MSWLLLLVFHSSNVTDPGLLLALNPWRIMVDLTFHATAILLEGISGALVLSLLAA